MTWIIIATGLSLTLCWLLFSPVELLIDTRIPEVSLRWAPAGKATLVYEPEEWWVKVRVFFFARKWPLLKIFLTAGKSGKAEKRVQNRKAPAVNKRLEKFFMLLGTFRVKKCQIAIDTGDPVKNAWLYPLNFLPHTGTHIYVNFMDENYLVLTIRNTPWRIIYAWIK